MAYTLIFSCGNVFPDHVSRQSRARGYVPETDSFLPAPDDFRYVHQEMITLSADAARTHRFDEKTMRLSLEMRMKSLG